MSDLLIKKFDNFTDKGKLSIDQICKKAAEIFSEKGHVSTTLVDIVHAAGICKGGIYHYFSSKEDLFFSVMSG
ncbi:MAG: TetR/AcrR family transcriptional regulator [Thermodesulfobacteriota bacterium]|nr:TetR/AcrR family transcriptional regulator [Thermodesulfobacteriota bacterium]